MSESRVPCEVYSRIVGYLRPVQNWNKGKKQEWEERRTYSIAKVLTRGTGEASARGTTVGGDQATCDEWAANDPPAWAEVDGR